MRLRDDSSSYSDAEARDVPILEGDLAGVEAGAYLDTQRSDRLRDGLRALHPPNRPVERDEEAVAHGLYLSSAVPGDLGSDDHVVLAANVPPTGIAEGCRPRRGVDDVGVHDGRQHPRELRLLDPKRFYDRRDVRNQIVERVDVVLTKQLDEPCPRSVLRDVPTLRHYLPAVTGAVQYQGRRLNRRQDVTDVGLFHGSVARDRIAGARREA